jgi:hypothetical protein
MEAIPLCDIVNVYIFKSRHNNNIVVSRRKYIYINTFDVCRNRTTPAVVAECEFRILKNPNFACFLYGCKNFSLTLKEGT